MKIIYQDKNERYNNRGVNSVGIVVCVGRVSRHLKEKYFGRLREWKSIICNSVRISNGFKKIIWQRRQ